MLREGSDAWRDRNINLAFEASSVPDEREDVLCGGSKVERLYLLNGGPANLRDFLVVWRGSPTCYPRLKRNRHPRNLITVRVDVAKRRPAAEDSCQFQEFDLYGCLLTRFSTGRVGRRLAGVHRTGGQGPSMTSDLAYEQQPTFAISDETCRGRPIQEILTDLLP